VERRRCHLRSRRPCACDGVSNHGSVATHDLLMEGSRNRTGSVYCGLYRDTTPQSTTLSGHGNRFATGEQFHLLTHSNGHGRARVFGRTNASHVQGLSAYPNDFVGTSTALNYDGTGLTTAYDAVQRITVFDLVYNMTRYNKTIHVQCTHCCVVGSSTFTYSIYIIYRYKNRPTIELDILIKQAHCMPLQSLDTTPRRAPSRWTV
jgi:hypothetical protein